MKYTPILIDGAERSGRFVVSCDHASNVVPPSVGGGDLGLPPEDMARHIAWDPGAWGVSKHLAKLLEAPAIGSNFSRLVIDPNRGEDDPTLIMQIYDGSIIPGNRHVDAAERTRRLEAFYRPYDCALAEKITPGKALVAVHSFTPQLRGRPPRPWEIGVLYPTDDRFARPFIARLEAKGDLTVGDNEPYIGYLPGDAVDRHATAQGLPNVLIELRNDLIASEAQQRAWAERLAPLLRGALEDFDQDPAHMS
ncbi:MAG: N-formylglutamate amidohydrolase [Rhodobacteraceae bacterium]|nr:N-formylglutamate amidohydrolase [Paracoccaceae bacterium]